MRDASLMPGKQAKFLAVLVAGVLHLGVAVLAFWTHAQEPQGQAKAAGTGGIEISLGPAGNAAGAPEQQEGIEQQQPKPEPKPEPKAEPKPEHKAEPKPKPKPEPKPVPKPEPKSKPKPVQEVQLSTEAPELAEPEQVAPPPATVAGASGKSGTREADNTGSGDNSAGGGLPGDTKDYAATLLAWLEKHREYPRRARMRRQEGTVLLYFVIDRQGRVLDQRIEKSSGFSILDDEVLRMLERAQPLPKMPGHVDKDRLELVVPVQFYLR